MKNIFIITIISLLTLYSCTSVSEDDLIDTQPITVKVTYNDNIKTIIDNNCVFCHADPPENGATNRLVTYEQVKVFAKINLLDRISKQTGEGGAMPLGGPRLPQALIDLVEQWIEDGLLEEN